MQHALVVYKLFQKLALGFEIPQRADFKRNREIFSPAEKGVGMELEGYYIYDQIRK